MDEENKKNSNTPPEENDWVDQLLREVEAENLEETAAQSEATDKNEQVSAPSAPVNRQEYSSPKRKQTPATPEKPPQKEPDEEEEPPRRRPKRVRVKRKGKLYTLLYLAVALGACGIAAVFCLNAVRDVLAISKPDQAVTVTIPEDATAKEIGEILQQDGIIQYPWVFEMVARFENYVTFEPGTHILNSNMDYMTLMKSMQKQEEVRETVRVTIPEGLTAAEMAKILDENGVCDENDFLLTLENTNFEFDYADEIPDDAEIYCHLEGYLFPDTYEFYKDDTALNVITRMLDNFDNRITPDIRAAITQSGMTFHEVITLASIIQGEAPDEENMAKVSAVYQNRLNNPAEYPLLQADPTRKYAKEQILADLGDEGQMMATAYNTYESEGLPPGPINNPGLAAIKAAVFPSTEMEGYYYFCSDLKTREFFYAKTLDEHNANLVKAHLR